MRLLIPALTLILTAFMASPTLAVKVVVRDNQPRNAQVSQPADSHSMPSSQGKDQAKTSDPGKAQPKNPATIPHDRQVRPAPQPAKPGPDSRRVTGGNDNFIDQNHDGINDRFQRPPEVIKRREPRRDHPTTQAPQHQPDREKDHQRDTNQTKTQDRRPK